jgi:sugar phosphate isomerase/epimerase
MRTLVAALRAASPRHCEDTVTAILDAGFDGIAVEEPLHQPTWKALTSCLPRERALAIRLFVPYPRTTHASERSDVLLGESGGDAVQRAVRRGIETLESADRLGIPRVLVPTVQLDLAGAPRGFSPATSPNDVDRRLRNERDAEVSSRMSAYLSTLSRLLDHAERFALRLCLTPSNRVAEMPSVAETRTVLEEFDGAPLGVWLDTTRWPAEHLAVPIIGDVSGNDDGVGLDSVDGVSIHDARGTREHLEIGSGEIDWPLLTSSIRSHTIGCLDVEEARDAEDFARGLEALREIAKDRDSDDETGADGILGIPS